MKIKLFICCYGQNATVIVNDSGQKNAVAFLSITSDVVWC